MKESEEKDTVLPSSDNQVKMSNSDEIQSKIQPLSSDKKANITKVAKQKATVSSHAELPQSGTKQSSILLGFVSLFVASITLLSSRVLKAKE